VSNLPPPADLAVLLRLLISHLLVCVVVRRPAATEASRAGRRQSWRLWLHSITAGLLAYGLVAHWSAWWLPLVIASSHVTIEGLTGRGQRREGRFRAGQLLHVMVLVGVWLLLTDGSAVRVVDYAVANALSLGTAAVLLAALLVLWPTSAVIKTVLGLVWSGKKAEATSELVKAGRYIGYSERLLVLIFMLLQRYEAIGLLIAAKSILRVGEAAVSSPARGGTGQPGTDDLVQKKTEYILLGTLLSFLAAIIAGLAANWMLRY